jgi:hypothetical protein
MRGYVILALIVLLLIIGFFYVQNQNVSGSIEPLGRLGFVKLANPDMYPGHPHPQVLAQYAREKGSKCALVVHYGGDSNYRRFLEGDVLILELAYVDPKGLTTEINWYDVLQTILFGVDEHKWKYRADGIEFNTLDEGLNYINEVAKNNGQEGPIPMVWHGSVRTGSPTLNQGCGFPLYVLITWKEYGRIAAYYDVLTGMILPYFKLPYRNFELQHAKELQYYYTHGMLNYE